MSDVRLSDASPTVERVDARQPDNVRSVSRMLFGTPDPEETRRYVEAVQQESAQDFMERYNFDPVTDTPLCPGIFEWVEDDEAPEFYHRPPHRSQRPKRGEARDSSGDERPNGEGSRRPESAQASTNGSRKRRPGASGSCSDECQKKRSSSDRDDDEEDPDCVGRVVKSASRPDDNQEVLLNAEH
ncbi:cyclin-dependent kinase inhibitor 1Ba [Nematolebias whitei]|uniref:cyclin-dependent kinase inhibitor 1Ba n=1 Tax=Nematolebias whitei TaxID=451745 RepID=UPI00189812ED|nr:cyclin-dependent kinase inhibitor 1Ba [Nematolebias whitei]